MSRRAYAKITPRDEQRIVAMRAEGLTFDVIAARIGCSKGTVWNALHAHELAAVAQKPDTGENGVRVEDRVAECTGALAKVRTLLKKTRRAP